MENVDKEGTKIADLANKVWSSIMAMGGLSIGATFIGFCASLCWEYVAEQQTKVNIASLTLYSVFGRNTWKHFIYCQLHTMIFVALNRYLQM